MTTHDFVVIGGGVVGLATALALTERHPNASVALLEKETRWAAHQSGRNSGVIHSGIYYKPGSLKARLAREGNAALGEFCDAHGIPWKRCGKLIVAADESELPRLEAIAMRGVENGLAIERMTEDEAKQIEPHVRCAAAVRVPSTGVVDYSAVCAKMAELLAARRCTLLLGEEVTAIEDGRVRTRRDSFEAGTIVACAGLQSDRVALRAGAAPGVRIVPFRGEYYDLAPRSAALVRGLIYPVPDSAFPFLGVHFTRSIDGAVHAGPNAVLSLAREGYAKTSVNARDLLSTLTYGGFWRLAARHARSGAAEIARSFSRRRFVEALRRLVPDVREEDLRPAAPGIRAQALLPTGDLVDDFLLLREGRTLHVLNAPSPAATASLEIGRMIAEELQRRA